MNDGRNMKLTGQIRRLEVSACSWVKDPPFYDVFPHSTSEFTGQTGLLGELVFTDP